MCRHNSNNNNNGEMRTDLSSTKTSKYQHCAECTLTKEMNKQHTEMVETESER